MYDLAGVLLTVSDFERAVDFYKSKLGFKPGRSLPGRWLELTGPGLSLFLVQRRPGQGIEGHGAAGLTLIVDDVDATKRRLESRGVSFIGDTIDAETLRLALFEDPDANPIYLVEPIEDHPTVPLPIIPPPIKSRLLKHFLAFMLVFFCGASAFAQQQEPRTLTLTDAVALALEKNGDVVVQREEIAIADATVLRADAAYDPTLYTDARLRHHKEQDGFSTNSVATSASLVKLLPTGATLEVFSSLHHDDDPSSWATSAGVELRQPLLRNRRIDPARAAIRIARIDRSRAESSVERVASETAASVERAYWTLVAARSAVEIRESALGVAEKQRDDTRVRISAGTQSESSLAETIAEVERRRGDLVSARESEIRAANALRNLIARDAGDPLWDATLVPSERVTLDAIAADVDVRAAIDDALASRAELRELALRLDRHDVDVDFAIDRTRPEVDLIAAYSGHGYSDSADEHVIDLGRFPDASIGVAVSFPLGNRAAKQDVAIARAFKRQTATTLEQARQQVAMEVRNAATSIEAAADRIDAARGEREAAVVALQAERDRFDAGTSNNFFVLTRQNDLAAAQLAEIVALTDYRKAQTELARATGSLLAERNIQIND